MSPTAQEFTEKEPIPAVKKYAAEAVGTFLLVLGGVGTAVISGQKVGVLGVAFAFGLTLLFLVYAIGPISGCHVNPAVTLGQLLLGRLSVADAAAYVISQLAGAFAAGGVIYAIAQNLPSYSRRADGLGANGWGQHSPAKELLSVSTGYGMAAAIVVELVLTAVLVFVVLASTDQLSDVPLAGMSIGLTLTVIHLVSIPVDNTSVNPARSLGVAAYQEGALAQVWVFIVFPLIGGALGALMYGLLFGRSRDINS